jgi:hypothetical protein
MCALNGYSGDLLNVENLYAAKPASHVKYVTCRIQHVDRDSSVGLATEYGLDGPGIESLWGAKFSAPVQIDPGAHPASCTMGTGSLPEVKSGRGVTLTPHPLLVPWS